VGRCRRKKKRGWSGLLGWKEGGERGLVLFFSLLFQPFTHKIFSSFQKLFKQKIFKPHNQTVGAESGPDTNQ
jgi:hypothetical protein